MVKLWRVSGAILGTLVLLVLVFVVFLWSALLTLEAKDSGLSAGLTVEETDRIMGRLFRSQMIQWEDIPNGYRDFTERRVARAGSEIREYSLFGLHGLSIVVVFDEKGHLSSKIPIYE